MMKGKSLHDRLRALGFTLFEAEQQEDANKTLADVVKSGELRLWEAFPLILANCAERGLFNYASADGFLKRPGEKACLKSLTLASLVLYKSLKLKFGWADALYQLLVPGCENRYKDFDRALGGGKALKVGGHTISAERLKSTFNRYFTGAHPRLNELLSVKEELGVEYALSQLFSPRQKELFLKKLKGEKFTKTEKEYYSRTVKKKVQALANAELHRMSQKLLG